MCKHRGIETGGTLKERERIVIIAMYFRDGESARDKDETFMIARNLAQIPRVDLVASPRSQRLRHLGLHVLDGDGLSGVAAVQRRGDAHVPHVVPVLLYFSQVAGRAPDQVVAAHRERSHAFTGFGDVVGGTAGGRVNQRGATVEINEDLKDDTVWREKRGK